LKSKKRDFVRFFKVAFKKGKDVIQKFEVSEYIQHYITRSSTIVGRPREAKACQG